MKNKILFYSSVKYKELFEIQRFYHIDIELLRNLGYEVYLSNQISDFLCFWRYNLSFIYFYKYGLFPAIISRLFGKRVYFTGGIDDLELGVSGYKKYKIQKFFFKLCYFFSTKCILVSKTDENNVMKIFKGKLPKRTCLSFHTIDIEKFHFAMNGDWNNTSAHIHTVKSEDSFAKWVGGLLAYLKTELQYIDEKRGT